MTAQIIYGVDFKAKSKDHKVAEGPFDFAALEAELAVALWCGPEIQPFYDPRPDGPKDAC